jgi:PAS domain S-box-containing protein
MKPTGVVTWIAGFTIALVLLGGVAWLNLNRAARAQESALSVAQTHRVRYELRNLLLALEDIETGMRGYVLAGTVDFLEPYEAGLKAVDRQLQLLPSVIVDLEQLEILKPLVSSRVALANRIVQLRRDDGFPEAQSQVVMGGGKAAMDAVRAQIARMDAIESQRLAERAVAADRDVASVRVFTLAGSGVSFVLLFGVFALVVQEQRARTKAELALRASQQEIAAAVLANHLIMEHSLDVICTIDGQGRFAFVSAASQKVWGYTPEELTGRQYMDFVAPEDHPITNQAAADIMAGLPVRDFENRYRRKDGSLVPMVWSASWSPAETLMFCVAHDITDRKRSDEALRQAHDELRAANRQLDQAARLKDEFLANMSHELRTPLNAILGLSESLLEQVGGTLTPRQEKSIATIASSGSHLLALINDILDLSKVEAGKLDVFAERIELDEFCQSCLMFVRTQAMQKDITLSFDRGEAPDAIHADPKRLKQILVNLLTNAVKFTPKGGRAGLTISAPTGEGRVRFTVHDSGIGIAAEDQGKLFKAFSQIDSGLSRSQEGTGLGLVLVARLAELQGGSVAVESEPGRGSRFIVTLPLTVPTSGRGRPSEDRRSYRKALVIEDDPSASERLTQYLSELGVESVLQSRGDSAVEAARRECPDVILLDLQLPGESGWVVLARLKDDPDTTRIPVLVVSVIDDPARSLALGAVAHFTKPISRRQLADFFQRPSGRLVAAAVIDTTESVTGPVVLLAEDNEANVLTIGGYLEDKGYALRYAVNGAEAVALAREVRPAVILMDIQMPVMDGLTAMAEIRKDAALRSIPIVALTALAMPGDRERCLAAGATDYMTKPVSLKALAELVARLTPPPVEAVS